MKVTTRNADRWSRVLPGRMVTYKSFRDHGLNPGDAIEVVSEDGATLARGTVTRVRWTPEGRVDVSFRATAAMRA
jgi:hypothetical protein